MPELAQSGTPALQVDSLFGDDLVLIRTGSDMAGDLVVMVTDVAGRQVFRQAVFGLSDRISIPAAAWAPGLYMVEAVGAGGGRNLLKAFRQ